MQTTFWLTVRVIFSHHDDVFPVFLEYQSTLQMLFRIFSLPVMVRAGPNITDKINVLPCNIN